MIRRFNYTQRKRIEQERITIDMSPPEDGGHQAFSPQLDLNGLDLPPDAQVMIEAYRGRAVARYDWGPAGNLRPDGSFTLTDMPENLLFRIKVVEKDTSILLAMADRVRPHHEEQRGSMVWVQQIELENEVWRLDFEESGNPTLQINKNINGLDLGDKAFRALVMPQVFRQVLLRALIVDGAEEEDEEGHWAEFLGFASGLHGEFPPRADDPPGDSSARLKWIEDAVSAFTRKHYSASDDYEAALRQ